MDLDGGLIVRRGREHLALGRRDRRVALDQLGVDPTEGLQAERQWRDVEQEDVLDLALEHARLNRGAHGDDLIRVDATMWLLPVGELFDQFLDGGHAGGTTDEDHLVEFARGEAGILEVGMEGGHAAVAQVGRELLELGPGDLDLEVLGAVLVGGDERQVDLGFHAAGEFDLGLLGSLGQTLQSLAVLPKIDALLFLELVGDEVHDPAVVVVAAEMGIAIGRLDLEDALADLQHGHVIGAAAEVEDEDLLILLLVEAVGERRRSRLVDDADDVEAGDFAGVLGRLPLRVVEVGRHGDHRVGHLLAEVGFRVGLELLQDHRRDLLGGVALSLDLDLDPAIFSGDDLVGNHLSLGLHFVVLATHEALDREDGVLRIDGRLPPGQLAHQALACLRKGDDRRRGSSAFRVRNNNRLAGFHDRDYRVRGPQVYAYGLCHLSTP